MAELIIQIPDVKNELPEVERVNDSIRELWARHALPEEFEAPVTICVEEILSNVIRHGRRPGEDCDIRVLVRIFDAGPGGIEVEISDNAEPFDPLSLPTPDLTVPIQDRRSGGLGVLMVRKMMDEVHYEYRDGRNHLRFQKRWQAPSE
jgi:anti-sigma regulatory factor (Ser/Thr protein kinase)